MFPKLLLLLLFLPLALLSLRGAVCKFVSMTQLSNCPQSESNTYQLTREREKHVCARLHFLFDDTERRSALSEIAPPVDYSLTTHSETKAGLGSNRTRLTVSDNNNNYCSLIYNLFVDAEVEPERWKSLPVLF